MDPTSPVVVPLLQEKARVELREVETAAVNVRLRTTRSQTPVSLELAADAVEIERVPVGRFVDTPPDVRQEGEVTVVPVVEEVVVKRLFLREEVRIARRRTTTPFEEVVTLRRQEAEVERSDVERHPPATSQESST